MSFIIKDLSYIHADKETLFAHLNLSIRSGEKIALTGNNGCGKSTFMRILAGELLPSSGSVLRPEHLYYVPQHFGQYDRQTIAQAMGVSDKLSALDAILSGDTAEEHFNTLNDDWSIAERTQASLHDWGVDGLPLSHPMEGLSGGEKTRIFLAGMELYQPTAILLDEPTNHLDTDGRERLYNLIQRTSATVLVISHDRTLLKLLPAICELSGQGLTCYKGNYDCYKEQKHARLNALAQQLEEKQKTLRLARQTARKVEERKAKQNVRGEKSSLQKGIPRILMGARKNNAENSSHKLLSVHAERAERLQTEIAGIKSYLPQTDKLKTDFGTSLLHTGKILITAKGINFRYPACSVSSMESTHTEAAQMLWASPLTFQLKSGDRLALKGNNGSGKTTLLKLITGELQPTEGVMERADFTSVYLDQEYSLICNERSILQQAEAFNHRHLPEHEVKTILNRYLFSRDVWNKPCSKLSGGEKMRLSFCCLMIADNTPDLFLLDEPTNNLDIDSMEIVAATIHDYAGTVIVISHDQEFLKDIGIRQELFLK